MPVIRNGPGNPFFAFIAALLGVCAGANPACAGDLVFLGNFDGGVSIPWLRQNTDFVAGAYFVVEPAIVTATKLTNSNTKLTLFLQLPQGLAPAPYPKWAGIEAFGDTAGTAPAVGDCVYVKGTVINFKGSTTVSSMTWMVAASNVDCGNTIIFPVTVSLADIATDTSATGGNQPGSLAEPYESTLLQLQNTSELTAPSNGVFEIYDSLGSASTYLFIDDFIYHYPGVVGTHFSSISGVLEEFDSATDPVYQLLPRGGSDVVVGL